MQRMKIYLDKNEYKVNVNSYGSNIEIFLDNNVTETKLIVDRDLASNLAEELLATNGEKTTVDWEEEVAKLQEEIEYYKDIIEAKEQHEDLIREKFFGRTY
jgi:hypothetical protein